MDGLFQSVTIFQTHALLGLHGSQQYLMMRLEGTQIFVVRCKGAPFDPLAQTVFADRCNDLIGMLFLRHDPSDELVGIQRCRIYIVGVEFVGFYHGLTNGLAGLLQARYHGRIIKDPTRNLTMIPSNHGRSRTGSQQEREGRYERR